MRRHPPAIHIFAGTAACSDANAIMTTRPPYRGGRSQGRRGFCDRGGRNPPMTGDSHFGSVREANQRFRQGDNFSSNLNQPPNFVQAPRFQQPPQFRQPRPSFQNQAFRQHRPRNTKPLDYREWEYAKTAPPRNCEKFLILSYNLLADYLAIDHRSKLYHHIPRYMLDWQWRKKSIMFELGLWSADIMCLQEIDRFQELEDELKLRGYSGIWKMRTGQALDGCAVFWRTSRFKLVYEEGIQYNKLGLRDNVAQICVLELFNPKNAEDLATLPKSTAGCNRVVVCNIHVLYNPRRGEFKLGQVRTLLERAHAVSKIWDDAPIVLCGDFNCTPKSPLYNFFVEQKLDLSAVDRDKVSGQASAEIRSCGQYGPNPGSQSAYNSTQAPPLVNGREVEINPTSSLSNVEREVDVNANVESLPPVDDLLQPRGTETVLDASKADNGSTLLVQSNISEENSSFPPDHYTDITETVTGGKHDSDYSSLPVLSIVIDHILEKKLDNMCLDDQPVKSTMEGEGKFEDDKMFISAVHGDEDALSPNMGNTQAKEDNFIEELVTDPNHRQLTAAVDEVSNDFLPGTTYNSASWTPMEIAAATGDPNCTLMEHPLQLKSTYTEVGDRSQTRDSNGEPLVTSYNRCFMGTVDYIWRSEGLQTVRVLAPMSKHAMQWTPGFPTKKWGSDHFALASELAFTKDHNTS